MRQRPRRHPWDAHAIKAEIHRRGMTLTGLAEQAGLEPSAVRVALVRPHKAGECAIAEYLGLPLSTLWPDRYCIVRKPDTATGNAPAATLNGAAA